MALLAVRYSGYDTAPVVNCSAPNLGKGCTDPGTNCGNVKCAMDNQPGYIACSWCLCLLATCFDSWLTPRLAGRYWGELGMDWLGAGGTKQNNLAAWSSLQRGHKNALGVMTTQWSSPPDTSGIPFAGEYGWNQAHTQQTEGCGV